MKGENVPVIIYSKETGEVLKDTPENRKLTFRTICGSDYNLYKKRYETISYGASSFYPCAKTDYEILRKAGLLEEHKQYLIKHYNEEIETLSQDIEELEGIIQIMKSEHVIGGLNSVIDEAYREIESLKHRLMRANKIK